MLRFCSRNVPGQPLRVLNARCTSRIASLPFGTSLANVRSQTFDHVPWNGLSARSLSSSAAAVNIVVPSDQLGFAAGNSLRDLPISNADERKVSVLWSPQNWSRFHHIWLRDHCRCADCFHPVTKQRLVNTFEIPPDIKPVHVQSTKEGLEVVWPSTSSEFHSSFYPWSWLQTHTYDPPAQAAPHSERVHYIVFMTKDFFADRELSRKVLWGSSISKAPPTITYKEAMDESDRGLYKWLANIDLFGFCLVSDVPPTPGATEKLSERIGFIRETQYGKFWEFTADLSKGDTAYTTMALGAHTDNTYFTDPCGLQLFHLLSHTEGSGGATLLVDGFYVASILKELYPELHSIISRVPIPAHAAGEPSALYQPNAPSGYPVLAHDIVTNELVQVRWNNDDRSVMSRLDPSLVEDWYNAIRVWHKLLTSPDSEYWIQLTPGTVLSVDNHRVLHGRSAFEGKRRVCGAYIGVDEYRSKLTVLREKFDPKFKFAAQGRDHKAGGRSIWSPAL
ncbi:Trimethyllysine dioxygenase [Leucogyrophana mollusca]|uniref:Trimethyllysine dioxygenase n=1 Tax=Leucogyrophana mollusca TaxID=85980 RepID=A0ACB8BQN0_9AGAM|nr:Trimethyllysine dioxygenase [Leucogyrophana mollusca]